MTTAPSVAVAARLYRYQRECLSRYPTLTAFTPTCVGMLTVVLITNSLLDAMCRSTSFHLVFGPLLFVFTFVGAFPPWLSGGIVHSLFSRIPGLRSRGRLASLICLQPSCCPAALRTRTTVRIMRCVDTRQSSCSQFHVSSVVSVLVLTCVIVMIPTSSRVFLSGRVYIARCLVFARAHTSKQLQAVEVAFI